MKKNDVLYYNNSCKMGIETAAPTDINSLFVQNGWCGGTTRVTCTPLEDGTRVCEMQNSGSCVLVGLCILLLVLVTIGICCRQYNKTPVRMLFASQATTDQGSVVSVEHPDQYDQVVMQAKQPVLLMFAATWCGHCKAATPSFQAAAKELEAKNVLLVQVDGDKVPAVTQQLKIQGYPTFMTKRPNQPHQDANMHERTTGSMVAAAQALL